MEKIKLDTTKIISKVSGVPVCDTYDGFFYDYEGYIKVVSKKDKKHILYNFVNASGEEISKVWFKSCGRFKDGMVPVTLGDGTHNILTSDGRLILRKNNNYISIKHFVNGFFIAQGIDEKYRLISRSGKQIKKAFDTITPINTEDKSESKYILVKRDSKCNIIGSNEEYLLDRFFINAIQIKTILDVSYPTSNPEVKYHKFIDLKTGQIVLEGEYLKSNPCYAYDCFRLQRKDGKYNVFNVKGKMLFEEWYDKITLEQWYTWEFECFYVYKKVVHKPHEFITLFDLNGNNIVNGIWFDKVNPTYFNGALRFNLTKNKYTYVYDSKEKKLILI